MIPGWDSFISEVGGVACDAIKFRPGAPESDPFGLTCRYRLVGEGQEWGWPGIHWGCDRGGSLNMTVYAPLAAESSAFIDHGANDMYGSEVVLRHWAGFYVRIAHMRPDRVPIAVWNKLRAGEQIEVGMPLGPVGDYGLALGKHTHVEVESIGESCALLDELLIRRWGIGVTQEYTRDAMLAIYAECDATKTWVADECLRDVARVKFNKGVKFWNRHLIRRTWGRSVPGMHNVTLYSSMLAMDF